MNIPVALCSHKPALHACAAISLCSCIAGPVQPYMSTDENSESEHEEVAKRTEGKASKSKKLHGGPRRYGYFMESHSDNLELAVSVPCVSSQKMRRRQHHPLLRYRPLAT